MDGQTVPEQPFTPSRYTDRVDKMRLTDDPRYQFGLPKVDNANYLWIQIFYSR